MGLVYAEIRAWTAAGLQARGREVSGCGHLGTSDSPTLTFFSHLLCLLFFFFFVVSSVFYPEMVRGKANTGVYMVFLGLIYLVSLQFILEKLMI